MSDQQTNIPAFLAEDTLKEMISNFAEQLNPDH